MLSLPTPLRIDDARDRGQAGLLGNRNGRGVLALVVVLMLASSTSASEPLRNVSVSWLGNSFAGAEKWVQQDIHAMAVTPDGTVYTNVEWDEAGASREQKFATGHIEVFRLADCAGVGSMEPSREVGEVGLQDIRECLRAHRQGDGS